MKLEQYAHEPAAVQVFPLTGQTDVILRRGIAKKTVPLTEIGAGGGEPQGSQEVYECEEKQFRYDGQLTQEQATQEFDKWWCYAPADPESLEGIKVAKVAEMSEACRAAIIAGVDVQVGDEVLHFSLDVEDQVNMLSLSTMLASGLAAVPYHADGRECMFFTAADFTKVVEAATTWKLYQESYFNSLRTFIYAMEDVETVQGVTYGMDIPEEYQSDVLKGMAASVRA